METALAAPKGGKGAPAKGKPSKKKATPAKKSPKGAKAAKPAKAESGAPREGSKTAYWRCSSPKTEPPSPKLGRRWAGSGTRSGNSWPAP